MSGEPATSTANREAGSWLDTQVEGRSVRFWIAVSVLIAVVVLGVGAWWVWGLGRGMPTDDTAMKGMGEMPATEVQLPPVAGFYNGEQVFFVHPEALRAIVLVTWVNEDQARELRSAAEVTAAAEGGELDLEDTGVVVNMPFLTWPEGGQR